jgi:hypothetical protein
MKIPRGSLRRSRVVSDPAAVLESALEDRLTGYAVLEPQDALLLDGETRGVLTFEDGVPVLAYDAASDTGGTDALADLAVPGPYSVELYELAAADLAEAHEADELRVAPGTPAERLAGDRDLAERTREAAPRGRPAAEESENPVEAFLADEEKIEAIREQAREEAQARAEEWGFSDELVAPDDAGGVGDAEREHPGNAGAPDGSPEPADTGDRAGSTDRTGE